MLPGVEYFVCVILAKTSWYLITLGCIFNLNEVPDIFWGLHKTQIKISDLIVSILTSQTLLIITLF